MLASWLAIAAAAAPIPDRCHHATDQRLICDPPADGLLDAIVSAWGAVPLERGPDRVVAVRWSELGPDPVELWSAKLGGGGEVALDRPDKVPDGPATARCGVGHREVALPLAGGTATFCLSIGGPPRLDGPFELKATGYRAIGWYRDGARVGPWRMVDPDGKPIAEGEYADDKPAGTWTVRGAAMASGDGSPTAPLGWTELLSGTGDPSTAGPTVELAAADLAQGLVAVRVRSPGGCDGASYAILRPGDAAPIESWRCPADLGRVRDALAAKGLDPLLPPPALTPTDPNGPAVDLEGHHIAIHTIPSDPSSLDPAELVARLPFLDRPVVETTFEAVPAERRRTAASVVRIPVVAAERGRWAVVYEAVVPEGDGWRVAVAVGSVHDVAEGL